MRRVLIVESPGLEDITSGDRRGEVLMGQLRLLRIPCVLRPIHSARLLEEVLKEEAPNSDVIHLCMHGNSAGISFTDGSSYRWKDLQFPVLSHARGKLLVLDACRSATFKPDATLAKFMSIFSKGRAQAPRCVLTMFGDVYIADSALAWGLVYRRLRRELEGASIEQCSAKQIKETLEVVKQAGLPKICASFWYERHGLYQDVTPWLIGSSLRPGPSNARRK